MRLLTMALVASALVAATAEARQLPSTGDLLDRYAKGDFSALTIPRSANDLGRFRQALEREAEAWLRRSDARTLRQRQLLAATIALETARAGLDLDWGEGRRLIEWGAELLRKSPADEPERLWHLAALALIQGAFDNELLVKLQKTTWPRFEREARFPLALVVMVEGNTWPDPDRGEPWDDNEAALADAYQMNQARQKGVQASRTDLRAKAYEYERRTRMRTAISVLEDLSNAEEIRAEALLRLGFLHMRLQRFEIAMEQFEEVVTLTEDPFLLYIAQLLTGMGHERLGDRANAVVAYRAALEAMPRAQAASFALASLLFLGDERDEAVEIIDAAIGGAAADDPWRTYQTGDFRFWKERIDALKQVLK